MPVTKIAEIVLQTKRRTIRYWAAVTYDLKNAFNSVSWAAIERAIHRLGVPENQCRILGSYVQNRVIFYDIEEGERMYNIIVGIPPGSILGPVF